MKMLDERLEAMAMNLKLMIHRSEEHTRQLEIDGQHIRTISEHVQALVRIAEIHEHRLSSGL